MTDYTGYKNLLRQLHGNQEQASIQTDEPHAPMLATTEPAPSNKSEPTPVYDERRALFQDLLLELHDPY